MKLCILSLNMTLLLLACQAQTPVHTPSSIDQVFQENLQTQLLDAKVGDVITLPEGRFELDRSLSLTVDGITLRGAGMDKTILSFKNQKAGAEGLLVTANDFTIEHLAIEDTAGDGLKINEGKNIIIRAIRTEWTNGPKTHNGAYGIYPVQTRHVLIEDCIAIGASDAGIYVGQSQNVIIRRNRAEYNVAGIEVENTISADVYENVAIHNTGGILIFNMPHLPQSGKQARIFDNQVLANNTKNFGHAGTPVASIPAGSGIVINSHDEVEVFNNTIADNKTANLIIASVYSSNYANLDTQSQFDPYPEKLYIYNNQFSGGGQAPDGIELKALKLLKFGLNGALPDILWDGYANPARLVDGRLPADWRFCVQNGAIEILNADAPNNFNNPHVMAPDPCHYDKLPPVILPWAG